MNNLPFRKPGNFYKGNLHTHSTRSDGVLEPSEVIRRYHDRGYDFIALTDHFLPNEYFKKPEPGFIPVTDTRDFRKPDFTTLLGAELHGPGLANGEPWHLVAVGLPLDFAPWTPAETAPALAKRAHEAGAYLGIAHPAWYALSIEDAQPIVPYAHAVEVYNQACSLVDRTDSWHFADLLLARGDRLHAFAADDSHFKDPRGDGRDAFGGWVQVKAPSLEPEALLAALKAGLFYSSTGPEIRDICVEGDSLVIVTSPVVHVLVTGRGAHSAREVGDSLEITRFPVAQWQEDGFCRVTVIDADGKRAWSNPIWFDQ